MVDILERANTVDPFGETTLGNVLIVYHRISG